MTGPVTPPGVSSPAGRGPVFVAGLERSGTTLLYALLASHPAIAMTRRTNLWTYFYDQYGDLADPANLDRCLDVMMRYKRLVKLAPDAARLRAEFPQGEPTYGRLFALLEQHHAERLGKPRWGDKSLNTERYAGPIFAAYSDARILHMIRDPRDRYASVHVRWKVRRGGLGAGTAEWLSSARLARRNQARYPDRYRIVRYEDLVATPEQTMRVICGFIGEEFDPALLGMDGAASFRRQGANSSYGPRPEGVIATDSIGRFHTVLSQRQIAFIQATAGRHMRALGYEPATAGLALRQRAPFGALDLPVELAKLLGWRVRHHVRNRTGRPIPAYRLLQQAEPA